MRGHGVRYPLLTEEDLISLVGAGDAFAFTVLHDRHSRATYSLARRVTGNAQDAFLKVWRTAGSYRADRGSGTHLDAFRGPQPRHGPAALAGALPEGTVERSLRRDLADTPIDEPDSLFTEVRGRSILRTSPKRSSAHFGFTEF